MRSLADRLSALGLDDRAIWARGGESSATRSSGASAPTAGHARLVWRLAVHADGAGRTV